MKRISFMILFSLFFFLAGGSLLRAQIDTVLYDQFDNGDGLWNTGWVDGATTVAFSIDNTGKLSGQNSYKVDVTNGEASPPDGNMWHIQRISDLPLVAGYQYTVSFMAVADSDALVNVLFELAGSPYTKSIDDTASITDIAQTFTYTMSATESVPTNMVKFMLGGAQNNGRTIWLDSIIVTRIPDPALVTKWGFLGGRIGNWKFTPGDAGGGANISVDATSSVEWAAIRGEFNNPITATTDKAILVTGNIEFVGAGIDTWSGLRYGLFMHDSAGTLITSNVDSTRWSGSESYSHGYMFTPVSGTNRLTDGVSGGVGTNWIRISGNYISTSSGSGPIAFAGYTPQQPARAVADAGKYAFAFSVQPLADGTKEVRFYLIKGDTANSVKSKYYFGGSFIDTSSIAPTFNGVCFAVHAGGSGENPDLRGVKLTDVKVDIGTPFTLPEAPFQAYYVDRWGLFGGKIGDWHFVPDSEGVIGNAGIGGNAPNTDWAVLRGEFPTYTPTAARPLKITGNINFVGGGFDAASSFRFGVFNTDSAGTYVLDTAAATLPDSTRWTGTDDHCTGYLFIAQSGSNGPVTWGDGNQGTWGAVNDATWLNYAGVKNYVLGDQLPNPSTSVAGTYDFSISITPQTDGTQLVKFNLLKAGDYGLAGEIVNSTGPDMFNSIAFGLDKGNSITAMNITNVQIDTGTITGVKDLNGNAGIPVAYSLSQNYPNPFNPTTTIRFALPKAGDVSLVVYDILGRKVTELIHGNLTAGYHTVNFNASNLASGVYFYRIQAGDFVSVKKLMLLK